MIVKSLLDLDVYKLSMGKVIFHKYPTSQVEYKFTCRSKGVDLLPYMDDIKQEILSLGSLELSPDEHTYLKEIRFLDPAFVDFLNQLHLCPSEQVQIFNDGNNLGITIKGSYLQVIWYETMILSIVNEIFFRDKMKKPDAIKAAKDKLAPKILLLEQNPGVKLSEFGTRRRHSYEVQDMVVAALRHLPNLNGTSNVHLAMKYGIKPMGSQAHEYFQHAQTIYRVQDSQKMALKIWAEEFDGDLGIALTDTLNMDSFLRDFSKFYAKLFDGCRHDSGDPIVWGNKLIKHYESLGIDPKTKAAIFSDGLTIERAIEIYEYFKGRINVSFGIGTSLTCDIPGLNPLSIVIKMSSANGQSCAKISDSPSKCICDNPTYVSYLKQAFGI